MMTEVSGQPVPPSAVLAAREYIRRFGGREPVDPKMRATASLSLDEVQAEWAKQPVNFRMIQAANALIDIYRGEENVPSRVVAIAHAKPGDPLPPAGGAREGCTDPTLRPRRRPVRWWRSRRAGRDRA